MGIVVVATALSFWNVQEYAITPGQSEQVAPLVSVKGLGIDRHPDQILLTDVYLSQLTALGWIEAKFQSHTEIWNVNQLVAPGVPPSQLTAQGFLEMQQAKEAAVVAALTALGWSIPAQPAGTTIDAMEQPSLAYTAGLRVADQVVSINGKPIRSSCNLVSAWHDSPVGTKLVLGVESATISDTGTITLGAAHNLTVATAMAAKGTSDTYYGCPGVSGPPASILPVGLSDAFNYTLPGSISIKTPSIGGPSAGLAMTLSLIDLLSEGSLTGHHTVSATGTMAPNGAVGPIGGVAEKVIAVENAGASVFIVPQANAKAARAASDGTLKILSVTTLAQALRDLRALGGVVPHPITRPYALKPTS